MPGEAVSSCGKRPGSWVQAVRPTSHSHSKVALRVRHVDAGDLGQEASQVQADAVERGRPGACFGCTSTVSGLKTARSQVNCFASSLFYERSLEIRGGNGNPSAATQPLGSGFRDFTVPIY